MKSKKHSRFLSFITLISVIGVALGVTALIVVLSVMDGFEVEMKKRLMSHSLHLLVTPSSDAPGYDSGRVAESMLKENRLGGALESGKGIRDRLLEVRPVLQTEAILRGGRKVSGISFQGIGPAQLEGLNKILTETADSPLKNPDLGPDTGVMPKVYLGQSLADEMDLIPGEIVTMISPTETDGPFSTIPRLKRFMVGGIYRSGVPEQELHTVFAELASVRAFLRRSGVVSQWEIILKDYDEASSMKAKLAKLGGPFRVRDWADLNSHLFASLRLERLAMFISLVFIVIVASFNIVTTLTLMVLEKKREIAILKAMGARDSEIGAIFLSEGLLIGGSGTLIGMLLGFGICFALKRWEFVELPDIYFDRTLPVSFLPQYYVLIGFSALVIVLVASVYPSLRASRTDPLQGIRFGG
jgi:lipoprotein-releasing system permease protein